MTIPRDEPQWKELLRNLENHLAASEDKLEIVRGIDRSALKVAANVEKEVASALEVVSRRFKMAECYLYLVSNASVFPTRAYANIDPQQAAEALNEAKSIGSIASSGPPTAFRLRQHSRSIALIINLSGEPYLIAIYSDVAATTNEKELLSFLSTVADQLSLMVTHLVNQKRKNVENRIAEMFFDNKLKPSACWDQILKSLDLFLPDWSFCTLQPEPLKQLLLFTEGENYLRISAGYGARGSESYVLVDNSISGKLILDKSVEYICVNPKEHEKLYKGYGNAVPESELAIALKSDDGVVGILNLEHPLPEAFSPVYINSLVSAARYLGPFVGALQARHEAYRRKETTLLYVITELLSRMGETYDHLITQPIFLTRDCISQLEAMGSEGVDSSWNKFPATLDELRSLVDQIQEYSEKFARGLPEFISYGRVDIVRVISDRLRYVRDRASSANVEIIISPEQETLVAYGSSLLQEHIFNLVNNSYQAIEEKMAKGEVKEGKIWLEFQRNPASTSLGQETGLRFIAIRIADTGGGVQKDMLDRIGLPGVTTKEVHGHGFGVAAAREYFESIGGNMRWGNIVGGFEVRVNVQEFDPAIHGERRLVDSVRRER